MRISSFGLCVLLYLTAGAAFSQTSGRPRLVVQLGHSSYLFDAAFSPDGRFVATSSDDRTVKLWDAATGVELTSFDQGHQAYSVEFSPDGGRLLIAGRGGKLWDVATGKMLREFKLEQTRCFTYKSTFAPDGRAVLVYGPCLTGQSTIFAQLFDAETGQLIRAFDGPDRYSPRDAIYFPDGSLFAANTNDSDVCLWDTASGTLARRIAKQESRIDALAVSPDSRFLATGALDGTVRLWDVKTGAETRRFTGHPNMITALAFSPDGRSIVSGGTTDDGSIRLWDVATGAETRRFGKSTRAVSSLAFSPDGRALIGVKGTLPIVWDVATAAETMRFTGYSSWVLALAMSADGRYLVSGCSNWANLWDLSTGERVRMFTGHASMVSAVAFSSDGRFVVTGSWDKTARLWDTATGAEIRKFEGHAEEIRTIAISPDGKYLLTGAADRTARLWDTATGALVKSIPTGTNALVEAVAFSPDSRQMLFGLTGSNRPDGVCQVRGVPAGNVIRVFQTQGDTSWVGTTPDGRGICAANGSRFWVWDARTGAETERYDQTVHSSPYSMSFSPDNRFLLTSSGAYVENSFPGTPVLWDRKTGAAIRKLEGHTNLVNTAAWSADGRFVATGSKDCTVRLWDPSTGRELCRLVTFADGTWVAVDPDGRFDTNNLERIPGLHWTIPDDPLVPLPVEIFLREYYEPRLMTRILGGERFSAVRPLASLNRVQPKVKILDVVRSKQDADRVDVRVEVQDVTRDGRRSGVHNVRLFRNGQLVGVEPGAGTGALDMRTAAKVLTFSAIRLPRSAAGSNVVFSAYAFNADRVKSVTSRKVFAVPPGAAPPVRRAYVVSIGVNASEDPSLNLRFAANDARRTSDLLVERLSKSGQFAEIAAVRLVSDTGTENQATKANIRAVIDRLAGKPSDARLLAAIPNGQKLRAAEPDDLVLVSFAGHGYADSRGSFYLVPHDSGPDARTRIATLGGDALSRCISSEELGEWLRDVDAGDVTLIVDACQSAALTGENFKPGPMGSRGLGQLAYDKGMRVLAATQADNVALEIGSLQQGLLTYALVVNGLEAGEADFQPKDGAIGLSEWLRYAVERVPALFLEMRAGKVRAAAGGSAPRILLHQSAPAVQQPALFDFARRSDSVMLR